MKILLRCTAAAALLTVSLLSGSAATEERAWLVGEDLQYKVTYGIFNAGTSSFTVSNGPAVAGRATVEFKTVLATSPKFFFKMYDEGVSRADAQNYAVYYYTKIQRERKENSVNVTTYNHAQGRAQRVENNVPCNPIDIKPNTLDVLGVIYFVRSQPLAVGKAFTVPVHDGKRGYTMRVSVKKMEKVSCALGEFDCLLVEPRLTREDGKPYTKGQMTLWLTDDCRHLPIRIRMSTSFGSINVELTSMKGVRTCGN